MATEPLDLARKAMATALDELDGRHGRDHWGSSEPQHMSEGYLAAARAAALQLSSILDVPMAEIGQYLRKHFLAVAPDRADPIADAGRTAVIEVIADRIVLDYDGARDPLLIEGRRRLLVHITAELAREWSLTPHETALRLLDDAHSDQVPTHEVPPRLADTTGSNLDALSVCVDRAHATATSALRWRRRR